MRLETLFSPQSIAVIGASTRSGSVGHALTRNLLENGYQGKIFPVNPKATTLFDLPCYARIGDIPETVDLAIIIIPAATVPAALREAGEKGVQAAVIISSGFKESDPAGQMLEKEIIALARHYHLALLGPNCLGFLRPTLGLNASFAASLPQSGAIAFFSQSGALCTAILDLAQDTLGFSHFISTGNKAVIAENDLLRFCSRDESVKIIGFYAEGISDAPRLIETGRALVVRPESLPVIALKSGTTAAGTEASSSHTGTLAGNDVAYQALFLQARILRAKTLEHLLELLEGFSKNPLPTGNRLGIVTNAGGLGVLATDSAATANLTLASLSDETRDRLRALPPAANIHNPVDVLGDALADRYRLAIESLIQDPGVDMLLVIVTPQAMTQAKETAHVIAAAKKQSAKPLLVVWCGDDSLQAGTPILRQSKVATLRYPESGARTLGALAQVAAWRTERRHTSFDYSDPEVDRETAAAVMDKARVQDRLVLTEIEAYRVLQAYGFPVPPAFVAQNSAEALAITRRLAQPAAMKIISPDISHKSDAGGVLLNVAPETGDRGYETLLARVSAKQPEALLEGVLVTAMHTRPGGREIILGLKKEPGLGTLVAIGLGGIFVETLQDIAMRFAPITPEDAEEMIRSLKSYPVLAGTRGQAGSHLPTLVTLIGKLSRLATDFPDIAELDVNPVLAFSDPTAFVVLDARIRLIPSDAARQAKKKRG